MAKHLLTFLVTNPQQITVEAEGDDQPFTINDGTLVIYDRGKPIVHLQARSFIRCELLPEDSKVVKP